MKNVKISSVLRTIGMIILVTPIATFYGWPWWLIVTSIVGCLFMTAGRDD